MRDTAKEKNVSSELPVI